MCLIMLFCYIFCIAPWRDPENVSVCSGSTKITNVMCFSRCACVSGFLKRFYVSVQWTVFAAATAAMFTISLVSPVGNTVMVEFHIMKLTAVKPHN